jgi:hypothetical protein
MRSPNLGCLLLQVGFLPFPLSKYVKLLLTLTLVALVIGGTASAQLPQPKEGSGISRPPDGYKAQAAATFANLPFGFEPNRGQLDSRVTYSSREGQYNFFLTSSEAMFLLPEHLMMPPTDIKSVAGQSPAATGKSTWDAIGMRLLGGNSLSKILASDQLPGKKNYYIGADQRKWASGVPLYATLRAHDVYDGIDLLFRNSDRQFEFDFLVNPGSDPKRIRLAFDGTQHIQIDASGDLLLQGPAGDLRFHRPVAYQELSDGRREVSAQFTKTPDGEITLRVGPYDHHRQLIIDPTVTYATYLGGTGQDQGMGIAIDDAGNTFVAGGTASPNFPNTGGGVNYAGELDAFVTEFNSSGQLVFSTILGGSGNDVATAIAVSTEGQNPGIFVTGYTTSPDFPANTNQFFLAGIQNALVFILHYPGGYYSGATYLGGEAVDAGLAITYDTVIGYVYVAGQTTSQQFPISSPLFNGGQLNMGAGSGASDAFVAEMFPDLSGFYFSTFLGGAGQDFASGIALDHPNSTFHNVYITGGTNSGGSSSPPSFYTTSGAFQPTCGTDGNCNGGKDDAFVTVICVYQDPPCNAMGLAPNYVYSTFLGGSAVDDAYSIAVDSSSNVYLTGRTTSTDFKLASPLQGTMNGSQNAFVSKMNPTGTGLVFSTYLGGSQTDAGLGIAIDDNQNIYLTGRTNSPDFPLAFPTQATIGGGNDAFISALNASGSTLTFSTFLGGSGDEDVLGGSIAVDFLQDVYVTGDTNSTNFPTQSPYQGSIGSTQSCMINGNQVLCPDAYVATLNVTPPNFSVLTVTINGGSSGAVGTVTSSSGGIDCTNGTNGPGICTADFPNGTEVTLTATPDQTQFVGWSGNVPSSCGTNLTCQIQINGYLTATATFAPVSGMLYSLTVSGQSINGQSGTGTVTSTPGGIDCGTGGQKCTANFAPNTQVTLTATPDSDSFFDGWMQNPQNPTCMGTGQCVVTMISNQTVNYIFLPNNAPPPQPDFTITVSPTSLGNISAGSQGVAAVTISTQNGFTDSVSLSCSVLPSSSSSPSCTVSPTALNIPVNGAGSATLAVNTSGLVASRRRGAAILAFFIPFLGILASPRSKSRHPRQTWLRFLLLALVLGLLGLGLACGGGSGGSSGGVAQSGNYTVSITAQGATTGVTHTAEVTVTVQ